MFLRQYRRTRLSTRHRPGLHGASEVVHAGVSLDGVRAGRHHQARRNRHRQSSRIRRKSALRIAVVDSCKLRRVQRGSTVLFCSIRWPAGPIGFNQPFQRHWDLFEYPKIRDIISKTSRLQTKGQRPRRVTRQQMMQISCLRHEFNFNPFWKQIKIAIKHGLTTCFLHCDFEYKL